VFGISLNGRVYENVVDHGMGYFAASWLDGRDVVERR